jgi:hypothetical protein
MEITVLAKVRIGSNLLLRIPREVNVDGIDDLLRM